MSLVSYSIPNLSNGVSQQPAALRLPTSCEEMTNAWPSVLSGLQKRPPTEWVANLGITVANTAAGHLIRRDDTSFQYVVIVSGSDLKVFDLQGNPQTVTFPYGKAYLNQAASPIDSLRFMTFGDYTFIANNAVAVRGKTYGEAGPSGTFSPTGTVNTYDDLPTSAALGNTYLVAEEGVYYKWENLPATDQIVQWVATTALLPSPPSGYSPVNSLPATVNVGDKVYINTAVYMPGGGVYGSSYDFYHGFTGTVTQAYAPAGPGWKAYTLSQLGVNNSGRLDPATHATVLVKQAIANSNYAVYINNVLKASYTTPVGVDAATSVPSTSVIASDLVADLVAAGYSATQYGSTISISGLSSTDKVRTLSPSGDKAMKAYRYTLESFSDLPPTEAEGRVVRIAGDPSVQGDDYYVTFIAGVWTEDTGWGAAAGFDASTMPHVLVRNSNGTWTFKPHEWSDRAVGDGVSNRFPAFVGGKINDIFVYSNRLGFLSDENVILSEADTFENFFRATVAQFLDSDRIDVAVFNKDVNILRHAVPFAKDLLLTADNNQFRLSYNGILSAKNIQIEYTTSFNVSPRVKPMNMGASVYFVDDRPGYNYGKVLEYYAKENQTGDDIDDLTEAVPEYIPGVIRFMAASPRMKLLVCNSSLAPTTLFVYKFYWAGGQKVQNAWGKWTFDDCTKIHWAAFLDNYLYVLLERPDGTHFEKVQVDENVFRNAEDFNAHVDRKVIIPASSMDYDPLTDKTIVVLPYSTTATPECITFAGDVKAFRHTVTKVNGTQFTVPGDITGSDSVVAGIPYTFTYVFSQQYMRRQTTKGQGLILEGRLQLRYMSLEYHNTAFFTFTVSTPGRDDVVTVFDGRLIGSTSSILGQASFATGTKRIPLMANSYNVTLSISNDSPYANAFGAAEWTGIYQPRSTRIN